MRGTLSMALVDYPVGVGGPLTSHAANVHNPEYFDLGEYNCSVNEHCQTVMER